MYLFRSAKTIRAFSALYQIATIDDPAVIQALSRVPAAAAVCLAAG
jgi:hypothetical protein